MKVLKDISVRFLFIYGGSSASKTYSFVQAQIYLMLFSKGENALVLRKFGVDIKDTIYSDFKNIIDDWGLTQYFTIQINYIRCNLTGSYVRFRGLDDSEKVKGISGFKRVIMEEISQFDEVDFKQVRKRLRGMEGQQIIGIFNPISEDHWIKQHVFDLESLKEVDTNIYSPECGEKIPIAGMWVNDKGNLVVMKTNYLDNKYIVGPHFVDQHVIDDFEKDKITDFNYYQVYGLGNWGRLRTGGEFWKDFNTNKHLTKIGWNESLPVFLWWDENVNPFLTCLVYQIYGPENDLVNNGISLKGKKVAIQIDEICLEDPRNRRHHVCNEFKSRYPLMRVSGVFVGGDRTSMKEDTAKEKGENFFSDVVTHLKEYRPQLRMQTVNPSVVQSAGFINACYRNETDLVMLVNEKCTKSISDFQYALEDSDGTLKKVKKKHPVTGVQYEEFGHPSDAKRYFATVNFPTEYALYLRGGKAHKVHLGKSVSKHSI